MKKLTKAILVFLVLAAGAEIAPSRLVATKAGKFFMTRRFDRTAQGATIARGLGDIVKSTLEDGGNVIFYPSGHIQTEPEHEDIGTRQLAYNICGDLPEGVRVICVRTRGLWVRFGRARGARPRPRLYRLSSRAFSYGSSGRRSYRAAA